MFHAIHKKGITNLLKKKFRISPSKINETLEKAFIQNDILKFHVDDLDTFIEIDKNWPLKGATSKSRHAVVINVGTSNTNSWVLFRRLLTGQSLKILVLVLPLWDGRKR